jgi:hypothetical protein
MAKFLIITGLLFVGAGVIVLLGVPLGRLPGDIIIRRGNSTFYLPIVTCLLVSVVLSVLMAVLRR